MQQQPGNTHWVQYTVTGAGQKDQQCPSLLEACTVLAEHLKNGDLQEGAIYNLVGEVGQFIEAENIGDIVAYYFVPSASREED